MTAFVTTVIVFATRIDFHTARPVAIRIVRPRCCFTNSTKLNFGKLDSIHPLRNWRACCWLSWRDSANSDKFTAHCRDMLRVATHQRRLYNSRFVPQGRSSVVEQRPFKPKVVGSIPTAPTMQLVDMQWLPLRLGHIWPQNPGYFLDSVSLFR